MRSGLSDSRCLEMSQAYGQRDCREGERRYRRGVALPHEASQGLGRRAPNHRQYH